MKLGILKSLKRTTDRLVVLMRGFQNILVHVGCITNTTCGFTGRRMILSVKLSKYLSIIISWGLCRQANCLFSRCFCMEFEIEPVYQPCETGLESLSSGNIQINIRYFLWTLYHKVKLRVVEESPVSCFYPCHIMLGSHKRQDCTFIRAHVQRASRTLSICRD